MFGMKLSICLSNCEISVIWFSLIWVKVLSDWIDSDVIYSYFCFNRVIKLVFFVLVGILIFFVVSCFLSFLIVRVLKLVGWVLLLVFLVLLLFFFVFLVLFVEVFDLDVCFDVVLVFLVWLFCWDFRKLF